MENLNKIDLKVSSGEKVLMISSFCKNRNFGVEDPKYIYDHEVLVLTKAQIMELKYKIEALGY